MILILGGTAEARALAEVVVRQGKPVTSSLAGRVSRPALPTGAVRIGGFGGTAGLVAYLDTEKITAVVDATHPFAARISAHAADAARITGVPLLRLRRPGWRQHPLAASWSWVADTPGAVEAGAAARRPFLTTGRQSLDAFAAWADRDVIARVVDPPERQLPDRWTLITARGPYRVDAEMALMVEHRVDLLVTKDSGGSLTEAKLTAAAGLGVPVIVIDRPADNVGVLTVAGVQEAVDWLAATHATEEHR